MLMNTKNERKAAERRKGESSEDDARLLSEDPMDWVLKNEKVAGMLAVSLKARGWNASNVFESSAKSVEDFLRDISRFPPGQ